MLATLAQLKARLDISDTSEDDVLNQVLAAASVAMARAAGRVIAGLGCLEGPGPFTEVFSPPSGATSLRLTARPAYSYAIGELSYPIVKEAVHGAYADADALTIDEDYWLDGDSGQLIRIGTWLAGARTVQAQYHGGYIAAAEWLSGGTYVTGDLCQYANAAYRSKTDHSGRIEATPDGDTTNWDADWAQGVLPLPGDINDLAIQQAAYWYQRRGEIGLTGAGVQGGSFQTFAPDKLLPLVRETMRNFGGQRYG